MGEDLTQARLREKLILLLSPITSDKSTAGQIREKITELEALIHSYVTQAEKRGHREGYFRGVNDFTGWYMDASIAAQRTPIFPDIARDLLDNYKPPVYMPLSQPVAELKKELK